MSHLANTAIFLLALSSLGRADTFGITTFRTPDGFQQDHSASGQVKLTHIDKAHGTFVQLVLYRAQPGAASAEAGLAREWRETAGANFGVPLPSKVLRGKLPDGTAYLEAGTRANGSSGPLRVTLQVFHPGPQVVSLMTVTSDTPAIASTAAALSRFVEGLRFAGNPAVGSEPAPATTSAPDPGARPADLVGTWIRGSVSGPALYDRISGAFKTYATGQGRYLELKANGQAHMTSLLTNSGAGNLSVLTARDGTWTAQSGILTIHFTSGTTEINSFGSRKTKPGKLGTETFPYARYSFEGTPALSLSVGDSGKESLYRGKN
jgi:hypothetical protein